MAECLGDRNKKAPLQVPAPHLDHRPRQRRGAEQVRLRTKLLDVTTDRDRFVDPRPIVELRDGYGLERVERREFGALVLQTAEIDLNARNRDAFLSKKNADAARTWREIGVVSFTPAFSPMDRRRGPSLGASRLRLRVR
jgi:hypothetical protein